MADFSNKTFDTNLTSWAAGKDMNEHTANRQVWFDAQQESYNDNDAIGTLTDQSGNSNDATQGTAANKPTFKTGVVTGIDSVSRDAYRFDGSNDYLDDTDLSGVGGGDFTLIVACTVDDHTDASWRTVIRYGTEGAWKMLGLNQDGSDPDTTEYGRYGGSALQPTAPTFGSATPMIIVAIESAGTIYGYHDGGATTPASASSSFNIGNGARYGGWSNSYPYPWDGDVYEYRIFNAALSTQELSYQISNLAFLYGITPGGLGATITRDTGIKYAGAASAKLVTVANGICPFFEVVNPGTTDDYELEGYVYTDGSEVTSSDIELYYGAEGSAAAVSTTFTSAGSGWYKMTATVTGANADRKCGVEVKASKTVYVDSFALTVVVSSNIKKLSSIAQANLKKVASITEANIKKIASITNT